MDIELIKSKVTCFEVAEDLGLEVRADGKTWCLEHDEDTPSMHLYDDHWWAYCCGKGGSVIDLVMAYYGCSFRRAMQWFELGATEAELEARDPVRRHLEVVREIPDMTGLVATLAIPPTEAHLDMIARRWPYLAGNPSGLDGMAMVPCEQGFMFPHHHNGPITGVKYRHFDGTKTSEPGSAFTVGPYNPFPGHDPVGNTWVICEGETDALCMAVHFAGQPVDVLGLPSGASTWHDDWVPARVERVFICMDNDPTGRKALDKIRRSVGWHRGIELRVPKLYGDAADALAAGWDPQVPHALR